MDDTENGSLFSRCRLTPYKNAGKRLPITGNYQSDIERYLLSSVVTFAGCASGHSLEDASCLCKWLPKKTNKDFEHFNIQVLHAPR